MKQSHQIKSTVLMLAMTSVMSVASVSATAKSQTNKATIANPIVMSFTQPVQSGRYHKPYVAVWLESADRKMVDTIALWYNKNEADYLPQLRTWWKKGGKKQTIAQLDGYSGATRVPKTYQIKWDGKKANGKKVANGTYWLNIEVSREHGDNEKVRKKITLGNAGTLSFSGKSEIGKVDIHWK